MSEKSLRRLEHIPLFTSISGDELKLIAEKLDPVSFLRGDVIINEGDPGTCLYIINTGMVKISAAPEDEEEEIILSYLTEGDYFGEMSLITGDPRSASVTAQENVEAWRLEKDDFDALIATNPSITLSLTHMLSHRLQTANKVREEKERYYQRRIRPKGNIEGFEVINLLTYAETNSLSGTIRLMKDELEAQLTYEKGQLLNISFGDKNENEALDIILQWNKGVFTVEPKIYDFASQDSREKIKEGQPLEINDPVKIFENYISEKFMEFIKLAGSRTLQSALNKSIHKFLPYFDVVSSFELKIFPELVVSAAGVKSWTDKHTLFLAVLMRDIVNTLERELIGMDFWNPRLNHSQVNEKLSEMQFFDYYEQAIDFIKD